MKVKAKIRFRDREADRIREPGEEFVVSEARYQKLSRLGLAEKISEEAKTEKKPKEAAG